MVAALFIGAEDPHFFWCLDLFVKRDPHLGFGEGRGGRPWPRLRAISPDGDLKHVLLTRDVHSYLGRAHAGRWYREIVDGHQSPRNGHDLPSSVSSLPRRAGASSIKPCLETRTRAARRSLCPRK